MADCLVRGTDHRLGLIERLGDLNHGFQHFGSAGEVADRLGEYSFSHHHACRAVQD
jgi:hypothetical protein